MIETDRLTTAGVRPDEVFVDKAIRPKLLADYIGQPSVKAQLALFIDAARQRQEALDHTLLFGPPGLGKTTLAHLAAHEMGGTLKVTSGPALEKVGDLASILSNLEKGDLLFIDEAHRLNRAIEEVLYPAMESRKLHIVIGKGPSTRTFSVDLPPFTLVAATTRAD